MPSTKNNHKEKEQTITIKSEVETSPPFSEGLDPDTLLSAINKWMDDLCTHPGREVIGRVYREMKTYELITLDDGVQPPVWLSEPLKLHRVTEKRPMVKRITHLLKSGGEWKSELNQRDIIETSAHTTVPMDIGLDALHQDAPMLVREDNTGGSALLITLSYMRSFIQGMAAGGSKTIGLFRKPDGIIAMNVLRSWIKSNETHSRWSIKDELEVVTLDEMVRQSVDRVIERCQ